MSYNCTNCKQWIFDCGEKECPDAGLLGEPWSMKCGIGMWEATGEETSKEFGQLCNTANNCSFYE